MPEAVLLDNDILLKVCRYLLVADVLAALGPLGPPAVLGSARFVLRKRIQRTAGAPKPELMAQLDAVLRSAVTVEPDEAEILLAADLQEEAQLRGLALDAGEGLLLAVLALRPAACLVTGDKRAIAAAEALVPTMSPVGGLTGKLLCLEQVMLAMMHSLGHDGLRVRICGAPDADRALANCFGCGTGIWDGDETRIGLHSYAADVLASAPTLLMTMDAVRAILLDKDGIRRP